MEQRSSQLGRGSVWGSLVHSPASTRSLAGVVALSALVAGMLSAPAAAAKPEYPGNLQKATGMSCVPACTLCHTDPAGGKEHLRPGGGWALWQQVANGTQPATYLADKDTDGDGVHDLDELLAGTDPGSANNLSICGPSYGCFASSIARAGRAGGTDGAAAALALAVAAAFVFAGRRRGRAG